MHKIPHSSSQKHIGIMGAMPEEIDGIIKLLSNRVEKLIAGRTYFSGAINDIPVVVVFSRWGKVAAASTVTSLIHEYSISELIFTGVAGGIDPRLKIGDIVIAEKLIQHDMDARPLMDRHEIPLLGKTWFQAEKNLIDKAVKSTAFLLANQHLADLISEEMIKEFKLENPSVFVGEMASGDQFFASEEQKKQLQAVLPKILCVEMEGAAVAQVCFEHDIPFIIIRTISDNAGYNSRIDFPKFIAGVASPYSVSIIRQLLTCY